MAGARMCMCSTPAAKDPSLGTPVLRLLETFSLEEVTEAGQGSGASR
jgi:hypothetical protein